MGLACVDGVGAGLWARKGHKGRSAGRVSRKLFAASDPSRNVQRNLQFAKQHLETLASSDLDRTSAKYNFDMQTMAPQPGPLSWTTTESAPQFYQPRAYTSHTRTSLPHLSSDTCDTSVLPACGPVAPKDLTAPTTATLVDATRPTNTNLTLAHTTTCFTLPTSTARPLSPTTTQTSKPVKRLQQRSTTTKVTPRKITDYFTEVRTPRLLDLGKAEPKTTDLLDSSAVSVGIRDSELRLED